MQLLELMGVLATVGVLAFVVLGIVTDKMGK